MDWSELVQRESARVEWKENVADPQGVVKTICAFANDFQQVGGGRVLCGLKEEKDEYNRTKPANGLIPQLLELKKAWPPYLDHINLEAAVEDIDLMAIKEFLGKLNLPYPLLKYLGRHLCLTPNFLID